MFLLLVFVDNCHFLWYSLLARFIDAGHLGRLDSYGGSPLLRSSCITHGKSGVYTPRGICAVSIKNQMWIVPANFVRRPFLKHLILFLFIMPSPKHRVGEKGKGRSNYKTKSKIHIFTPFLDLESFVGFFYLLLFTRIKKGLNSAKYR